MFFFFLFIYIYIYFIFSFAINERFFSIMIYHFFLLDSFFFKFLKGFLLKKTTLFLYFTSFFLHFFIVFLKYNLVFKIDSLIDIFAVDLSLRNSNLAEVNYCLLNYSYNFRFFLKIFSSFFLPIPSLLNYFSSANWLEREVWDLFGIRFFLNDDLRRILTDYGFLGHVLCKNFPLVGYLEYRYDDVFKVLVAEPVTLSQSFRFFKFVNPWFKWKFYD